MKVIFLDIDGVLNRIGTFNRTTTRWRGYIGMEPELVYRFNDLVHKQAPMSFCRVPGGLTNTGERP
jgi:hypothetical protein